MKNNDDKLLREKMAAMNTLSGGVVFGKEEAWDKLQARMDVGPAKRSPVRYWMAAAAVLLLIATVLTRYYSSQEVRTAVVAPKGKGDDQRSELPAQAVFIAAQPPQQSAPAPVRKVIYSGNDGKRKVIKVSPVPVASSFPITVQPETGQMYLVTIPAPVSPVNSTMKVVHINDVENGGYERVTAAATTSTATVAVAKLPVVHINDVEREAVEVKAILRENRFTGRLPFHRAAPGDDNSNTEEYTQPVNLLKRKQNIQN